MSIYNVILGDVSKPKMKGKLGLTKIGIEPPAGLQQHFLDDIAGIHTGGNRRIKAQIDHAPYRLAMIGEQAIPSVGVARTHLVEEFLSLMRILLHEAIVTEKCAVAWFEDGGARDGDARHHTA